MKYQDNIKAVAALQPDYLGFIFYDKSARNFKGNMPQIPDSIKKVGVFVDAPLDFVIDKVKKYDIDAVQLHGNESAEYCEELKKIINNDTDRSQKFSKPLRSSHRNDGGTKVSDLQMYKNENQNDAETARTELVEKPVPSGVEVWKVFSVKDKFDFGQLLPYERTVDCFLFDTKGKEKGGNGFTFDWSVLNDYPSKTPFILSGGIGLDEIDQIRMMLKTRLPMYAIDVNSKLEDQPGLKNIEKVTHFLTNLRVRRDVV